MWWGAKDGFRSFYCHPSLFLSAGVHNDGNGHFTEVSHKMGLDKPAKAWASPLPTTTATGAWICFVANDSMPEFLFHHKADGTFEEVGLESEVAVNAEGEPMPAWASISPITTMTAGPTL